MGKGITGVLALCAAGLLGVLVLAPHLSAALAVALVLGIAITSAAAWCIAIATAVIRLVRHGHGVRAVVALAIFFWVPIVPPLCFGLSGIAGIFRRPEQRATQRRVAPVRAERAVPAPRAIAPKRFTLPPVDDLVLSAVKTPARKHS